MSSVGSSTQVIYQGEHSTSIETVVINYGHYHKAQDLCRVGLLRQDQEGLFPVFSLPKHPAAARSYSYNGGWEGPRL